VSFPPFPCWCPGHGVPRSPHTSAMPCGDFICQCETLRVATAVPTFVLAILHLLPLTCLYLVLAVQPVYFWGCPPPGSWWQAISFSLSCCSYSSAETFVLLNFLLLLFPGFSRTFYFSFVLCLFLCPAGVVDRSCMSLVPRR